MSEFLPASWAPVALMIVLLAHRFGAHSGGSDFEGVKGERSWTTVAFVVTHTSMVVVSITGGWMGWHPLSLPVSGIGFALVLAGVVLTRTARKTLAQHFSIFLKADEDHELITAGVYGRIRHPLYTAELLLQLGAPLAACTPEALVFLPIAATLVGLRVATEERLLSARYPEYAAYVERTRRLI